MRDPKKCLAGYMNRKIFMPVSQRWQTLCERGGMMRIIAGPAQHETLVPKP